LFTRYRAVSGNEMAMYVTTNSGTFAMKISPRKKVAFKNKYQDLFNNFNLYEVLFDEYVKKNHNINDQVNLFLQFLRINFQDSTGNYNLGLDLYEKDSSGKWNKLELASNGTVTKHLVKYEINISHFISNSI
jgi:hypothetical protein